MGPDTVLERNLYTSEEFMAQVLAEADAREINVQDIMDNISGLTNQLIVRIQRAGYPIKIENNTLYIYPIGVDPSSDQEEGEDIFSSQYEP